MDTNQRQCPICKEIITHVSEKNAVKLATLNKSCSKCRYSIRKMPTTNTCPLCNTFSSKRLTLFEKHLIDEHATLSQQLWDDLYDGPKMCACGCGKITTWRGWKNGYGLVVIGHNGNIIAIHGEEKAKEISDKRRSKLTGQTGWSKGLTKENDERVATRAKATSIGRKKAFNDGKIVAWSKGLTKETDERVNVFAMAQKQRFALNELTPWAKGLTKETDERIAEIATKVSLAHQQKELRLYLDSLKRLKIDEIKKRIELNGKLKVINDSLTCYINDNTPNINVECTTCGDKTFSTLRRLQRGKCYNCDPGGSLAQHELANWIRALGVQVDTNRRDLIGVLELDIYVPEHRLAIEYNGLYWHSVLHKSSIYHSNKSELCRNNDITLIHVFEDEWRDKRQIIGSLIKQKLNLSPQKVDAQDCQVVELTDEQHKNFFNDNHIDGKIDGKNLVTFGLSLDNEILTTLVLKVTTCEVVGFCTKIDCAVVGGLSRLTAKAIEYAKKDGRSTLLTYVDARLGTLKSWSSAGWKQVDQTVPRFWWTDFSDRYNRFKFKADKKNGLTEAQVAERANVVKIWGCKNLVYSITF